jgi:hypothetical protein
VRHVSGRTGITAWEPLRRWAAGPGTHVGVVGLGGLGHLAVKCAHALGAQVTVFATPAGKGHGARALGADDVVVSTDEKDMSERADRFDLIIDTVPSPHILAGIPQGADPNIEIEFLPRIRVAHLHENLRRIGCPRCGNQIDLEWFERLTDLTSPSPDGFDDLTTTVPCCGHLVSLADLDYDCQPDSPGFRSRYETRTTI